jgi:hypothetical protein
VIFLVARVVVTLFVALVYVLVSQGLTGRNFLKVLKAVILLALNLLVGLTHRLVRTVQQLVLPGLTVSVSLLAVLTVCTVQGALTLL